MRASPASRQPSSLFASTKPPLPAIRVSAERTSTAVRARRSGRSSPTRAPDGDRDRVEDLLVPQRQEIAGLGRGPARSSTRFTPAPPTISSTSATTRHQVIAPSRIRWWTPPEGALVTGPGTPSTSRLSRFSPVRGVEGATPYGRLHDHGPLGDCGDHPVAGQEPYPLRRAPGGASDTTAPCSANWSTAAVRLRVGAVNAARQDRDRGPAPGQRATMSGPVDPERRP